MTTPKLKDAIHVGALGPTYVLTYDFTTKTPWVDLTQATGGFFEVAGNDNAIRTWTGTVSLQTATSARLSYSFQSGDLPIVDKLRVSPHLTMPAGAGDVVAETGCLVVFDPLANCDC